MRTLTAEHKAKLSAALTGRRRGPWPAERKAKLSAALTGRKLTSEHKANIGAAGMGRVLSAEHKAALRASVTVQWTPAMRAEIVPGRSRADIAARVGVSIPTLVRHMRREGLV